MRPNMAPSHWPLAILLTLLAGMVLTEDLMEERKYTHPQYQDPGPCPCDLTASCDTYCCCDPDCRPFDELNSNQSCIEGLLGGNDEGRLLDMNCSRPAQLHESYLYNLLCISMDNSPYLGEYYEMTAKLATVGGYDNALRHHRQKSEKQSYTYVQSATVDHSKDDLSTWDNETRHYREGVPVKVLYDRTEGIRGQLSLPTTTLTGECIPGPVRFLVDSRTVCSHKLSRSTCAKAKNTRLDHQMYLMQFPGIEEEPTFGQVLQNNNHLNVTKTRVRYYTTNSFEAYISSRRNKDNIHDDEKDDVSSLADAISEKMREVGENSLFEEKWDVEDYDKLPFYANFDDSDMECQNIVLEVKYRIKWRGVTIPEVAVDVLLGNVSLERRDNITIYQYFSVSFTHLKNPLLDVRLDEIENIDLPPSEPSDLRRPTRRSGNPGYLVGRPLIFRYNTTDDRETNATASEGSGLVEEEFLIESANVPVATEPRIFGRNAKNSLCADNQLSKIRFGVDTISECFVRLTQSDLQEGCQQLAEDIGRIHQTLFPPNLAVEAGGSRNFTNPNSSIAVLYEDIDLLMNTSLLGESQQPVLGVAACAVPATIRITVLYTDTGLDFSQPVRKVNALKLTPFWDTWQWSCRPGSPNLSNCSAVQKYRLRTEVEYIKIPVRWHLENTTRFWILQSELSCEGDICWEDMLAPFKERIGGFLEVLEWIFIIIVLVIPSYSFYNIKL